MKICYFGDYDSEYSRHRVLLKGLKKNNVQILECQTKGKGIKKYFELIKKHKKIKNDYDFLLVGYSDDQLMSLLAKLLSKKKVVWDAFYSLYDAYVFDKQLVAKKSLKAKVYYFLDWLSCKLVDVILLDTDEHIKYFSHIFKTNKEKFIKVLVGSDDEVLYPVQKESNDGNKFIVNFIGNHIPLQGVEYILRAAKILKREKDVEFRIIGTGQKYNYHLALAKELELKNVQFFDKVNYEEMPDLIKVADVCLGIFGKNAKTGRVIPNKIYDAIAMAKPVISARTAAIKELFEDRKNILLCHVADEQDLADKILEIKNNFQLREKIAQGGYKLFQEKTTPEIVVKEIINYLQDVRK